MSMLIAVLVLLLSVRLRHAFEHSDCDLILLDIGSSEGERGEKTVFAPDVESCPEFCGPGCRSNTDYLLHKDCFALSVQDGYVTARRHDEPGNAWGMLVRVPCCNRSSERPESPPISPVSPPLPWPDREQSSVVYVSGSNPYGQLGLGDNVDRSAPQPLAAPNGFPITAMSMGWFHSSIVAGGALFTFGGNNHGQLGLGTDAPFNAPQLIRSPNGGNVTAVALGAFHSAFIAGGEVFTFGWNEHGQLGLNDTLDRDRPHAIESPNGLPITAIAMGTYHSAFLAGDDMYVFGGNEYGQLGLGDDTARHAPHHLPSPNGHPITAIVLGGIHSAFIAGNDLFLFGGNHPQFGLVDPYKRSTPTKFEHPGQQTITAPALGGLQLKSGFMVGGFTAGSDSYAVGSSLSPSLLGLEDTLRRAEPPLQFFIAPNRYPVTASAVGSSHFAFIAGGKAYVFDCVHAGSHVHLDHCAPLGLGFLETRKVSTLALGGAHMAFLTDDTLTTTASPTGSPPVSVTADPSPTPTNTPLPTHTLSFTDSPTLQLCSGRVDWPMLAFTTSSPCHQPVPLSAGSTWYQQRSLLIHIMRLPKGHLAVQCQVDREGDACGGHYDGTHTDRWDWLVLPTAADVQVLVVYNPVSNASVLGWSRMAYLAGDVDIQAEFLVVHYPSFLLLLLVCAASELLLLTGTCVWYSARRSCAAHAAAWEKNPRLDHWPAQLGLLLFGHGFGVVFALFVTVLFCSHPRALDLRVVLYGSSMVAMGLLTVALGAWALRDPAQHHCVVCEGATSRWRFKGVYLPPPPGWEVACQKAHPRCVCCVKCGATVYKGMWGHSHVACTRIWHDACWEGLCQTMKAAPDAALRWCRDQGTRLTDLELVLMLATAVCNDCPSSTVLQLLRLRPHRRLHTYDVPGWPNDVRCTTSVMYWAARNGRLDLLQALPLDGQPDEWVHGDDESKCSLCLQGLSDDADDVYVYQPLLTYNDRSVYVGHTTGNYIYYYVQDPNDKQLCEAGWCLGRYA